MAHSWQCIPYRLGSEMVMLPDSGSQSAAVAVASGTDVSSGLAFDSALGIVVTSRQPCTIGFKLTGDAVLYVEHSPGTRFYPGVRDTKDVLFTCTDIVRVWLCTFDPLLKHGDGSNHDAESRAATLAEAIAEALARRG